MVDVAVGKKLGELLLEKEYVSGVDLQRALSEQARFGKKLGEMLVSLGYLRQWQLDETICEQLGIERIELENFEIPASVISKVPAELVSKHSIIPFDFAQNTLSLAMADPFNRNALEDLRLLNNIKIKRFFARSEDLEVSTLKHYGSNIARMLDDLVESESGSGESESEMTAAKLQELAREPSLVNLVNLILLEAVDQRASDVHIEPFEGEVKIKYRVDGMLIEKSPAPKKLQAAIISRIKIMAAMDISERFIPQDGHIEFQANKGKVDIRVSTVPSVFGEAVTMRILDRNAALTRQSSKLSLSKIRSNISLTESCRCRLILAEV